MDAAPPLYSRDSGGNDNVIVKIMYTFPTAQQLGHRILVFYFGPGKWEDRDGIMSFKSKMLGLGKGYVLFTDDSDDVINVKMMKAVYKRYLRTFLPLPMNPSYTYIVRYLGDGNIDVLDSVSEREKPPRTTRTVAFLVNGDVPHEMINAATRTFDYVICQMDMYHIKATAPFYVKGEKFGKHEYILYCGDEGKKGTRHDKKIILDSFEYWESTKNEFMEWQYDSNQKVYNFVNQFKVNKDLLTGSRTVAFLVSGDVPHKMINDATQTFHYVICKFDTQDKNSQKAEAPFSIQGVSFVKPGYILYCSEQGKLGLKHDKGIILRSFEFLEPEKNEFVEWRHNSKDKVYNFVDKFKVFKRMFKGYDFKSYGRICQRCNKRLL